MERIRLVAPPSVLGYKLVSSELTRKRLEVCSLLPQQLVNPPQLWPEGQLLAHTQPLWKWRYSSSSPLPSSFYSVLQGLANPLPGHGGEIAVFFFFFKALCWLDFKVTGIQGLEKVGGKMRCTASKACEGFTSAFSGAIPEVISGNGLVDWKHSL